MSFEGINVIGLQEVTVSTTNATVSTSNVFISGSGGVVSAGASFSGSLAGSGEILFNHNLNSSNLLPKLYVRLNNTNNWQEPDWRYNDSVFEKDLSTFGTYNFTTGVPINGWSGVNMSGINFIGFSGGSGIITTFAQAGASNLNQINNSGITSPCFLKKIVGDFDVWARVTGIGSAYTNSAFANLVVISLNETGINNGSGSSSFTTVGVGGNTNIFTTTRVRDGAGNHGVFDSIGGGGIGQANFVRISRYGNIINTYSKTGIMESWHNTVSSLTGKAVFNGTLTDEVYVGMALIAPNYIAGITVGFPFFKTWSPVELIASGGNNMVIRNNTQVPYDIMVSINGAGGTLVPTNEISFFVDFPFTGSNISETFVQPTFTLTGYSLGCTVTGSGSIPMSGNIYQRDTSNNRYTITGFTFSGGQQYKQSGGFNVIVTGQNRIGFDITNNLSGIRGFNIGIFGN